MNFRARGFSVGLLNAPVKRLFYVRRRRMCSFFEQLLLIGFSFVEFLTARILRIYKTATGEFLYYSTSLFNNNDNNHSI